MYEFFDSTYLKCSNNFAFDCTCIYIWWMFNYNFWTNVPICIIFLMERSSFHSGLPLLILLPSDSLKFLYLNIYLGLKSRKKSSNITKLAFVFHVNDLCSYTKNCDRILDTFYTAISKSFLNLCSAITFEWMLWFQKIIFCWKNLVFMVWYYCQ